MYIVDFLFYGVLLLAVVLIIFCLKYVRSLSKSGNKPAEENNVSLDMKHRVLEKNQVDEKIAQMMSDDEVLIDGIVFCKQKKKETLVTNDNTTVAPDLRSTETKNSKSSEDKKDERSGESSSEESLKREFYQQYLDEYKSKSEERFAEARRKMREHQKEAEEQQRSSSPRSADADPKDLEFTEKLDRDMNAFSLSELKQMGHSVDVILEESNRTNRSPLEVLSNVIFSSPESMEKQLGVSEYNLIILAHRMQGFIEALTSSSQTTRELE